MDGHDQPASPRKRGGGPRTPEGKLRSSQNRLDHGCCSKAMLLPTESPEEFDALAKSWLDRYKALSPTDVDLVRQVVKDRWRMKRSEHWLDQAELELLQAQPDATKWTPDQHQLLNTFRRYKTADANAFHKSVRLIEHLRSSEIQVHNNVKQSTDWFYSLQMLPKEMRDYKKYVLKMIELACLVPEAPRVGNCSCPLCDRTSAVAEIIRKSQLEEPSPSDPPPIK